MTGRQSPLHTIISAAHQKLLKHQTLAPDKAARIPIGGRDAADEAAASKGGKGKATGPSSSILTSPAAAAAAARAAGGGRKIVVFLSSCDGVEVHHRCVGARTDTPRGGRVPRGGRQGAPRGGRVP